MSSPLTPPLHNRLRGAALALGWAPRRAPPPRHRREREDVELAGVRRAMENLEPKAAAGRARAVRVTAELERAARAPVVRARSAARAETVRSFVPRMSLSAQALRLGRLRTALENINEIENEIESIEEGFGVFKQ